MSLGQRAMPVYQPPASANSGGQVLRWVLLLGKRIWHPRTDHGGAHRTNVAVFLQPCHPWLHAHALRRQQSGQAEVASQQCVLTWPSWWLGRARMEHNPAPADGADGWMPVQRRAAPHTSPARPAFFPCCSAWLACCRHQRQLLSRRVWLLLLCADSIPTVEARKEGEGGERPVHAGTLMPCHGIWHDALAPARMHHHGTLWAGRPPSLPHVPAGLRPHAAGRPDASLPA